MRRLLVPHIPKPGKTVELPETEAKHAIHVLRLRDGETVEIIDGLGARAAAWMRIQGQRAFAEATGDKVRPQEGVRPAITLELAILKGQAMEWAVEKVTELGIHRLVPVLAERTVVRLDRKGPGVFIDRWQKISDQALKQCGRLERLEIAPPLTPSQLATAPEDGALRLWCEEKELGTAPLLLDVLAAERRKRTELPQVRVLVGPEGGWSDNERTILSDHYTAVSLGPLVLRAETAALFAASVSSAVLQSRMLDNEVSVKEA
jgi:16S rRNA (uracil1498-N3)-methyltransferase